MELGFQADSAYRGFARPFWVSGPYVQTLWGIRLKGRTQLWVETYRCTQCGYLESYAPR
jgi:hypothetical protein